MNLSVLNPFAYYKQKKEVKLLEAEKRELKQRLEAVIDEFNKYGVPQIIERNADGDVVRFGLALSPPKTIISMIAIENIKAQLMQFGDRYNIEIFLNIQEDDASADCDCPHCLREKYDNAIVNENFEEARDILSLFKDKHPEMDIEKVETRPQ